MSVINNLKLHVKSRIRSFALVVVAEKIADKGILLLKEAFNLYAGTVRNEMGDLKLNCTEQFNYKSFDARDLFLRNLPLILSYGGSGSYLVRKSNSIDWVGLINDIKWPGKETIVKETKRKNERISWTSVNFKRQESYQNFSLKSYARHIHG